MQVSIRKFEKSDIPNKIKWINDPRNNAYLHYNLPLELDRTKRWFESNKDRTDRYDATIICDGVPVGIVGLLSISNGKAEYYITMGEQTYKGKGIATKASLLLFEYAKKERKLNRLELFTEVENVGAQRLFNQLGFIQQAIVREAAINRGKRVDCFYYTLDL